MSFIRDTWNFIKEEAKAELILTLPISFDTFEKKKKPKKDTRTPQEIFIDAIKSQNEEEVSRLISNPRININQPDLTGRTPIQHAVNGRIILTLRSPLAYWIPYRNIVRLLLDNGAEIDFNLLVLAVKKEKDPKVVQMLIDKGVPTDHKSKKGRDIMHLAAKAGSIPVIEVLINNGIPSTQCSHDGKTPLHVGAKKGNSSSCEILAQFKANLNARDLAKQTPLHCAIDQSKTGVRKSLNRYAAFVLMKLGAKINARDDRGRTPLFIAAAKGDRKLVVELIQRDAKLEKANHENKTPLHVAIEQKRKEIVFTLLQHGALFDETLQSLAISTGQADLLIKPEEIKIGGEAEILKEVRAAFYRTQNLINEGQLAKAKKSVKEDLNELEDNYSISDRHLFICLYHQLGFIQLSLGNTFEGRLKFEKIIEILKPKPQNSFIRDQGTCSMLLAYYHQVINSGKADRYIDEAADEYKRLKLDSATQAQYAGNMGILYYNSLNMVKAKSYLKQALSMQYNAKFNEVLGKIKEFNSYKDRGYRLECHRDFFGASSCLPFEARRIKAVRKGKEEDEIYGVSSTGKHLIWVREEKTKETYDEVDGHSKETKYGPGNPVLDRFW